MQTKNPLGLIDQTQLAEWLGKSEAWAERSRWDGSGPPFVKIGRSVMYRVEDVEAWLESNLRTCSSDDDRRAA